MNIENKYLDVKTLGYFFNNNWLDIIETTRAVDEHRLPNISSYSDVTRMRAGLKLFYDSKIDDLLKENGKVIAKQIHDLMPAAIETLPNDHAFKPNLRGALKAFQATFKEICMAKGYGWYVAALVAFGAMIGVASQNSKSSPLS